MATRPVPEGYHTVTPYLIAEDAEGVIRFLGEVFGATEVMRLNMPDGSIMHAEVQLGDSRIMLGNANAQWPAQPGVLHVYVDDVDDVYQRALAAGATSVMEPADQFHGDRHGGVRDLAGNQWWIATTVEQLSPEEVQRRADAYMAEQAAAAGTA